MPTAAASDLFTILDGQSPLICAAIHDGHTIRDSLRPYFALSETKRRYEEDPFTGELVQLGHSRIIADRSRFEVDLNRPPDKAVYRTPEDAWGLTVWREALPEAEVQKSMEEYEQFYAAVRRLLDDTVAAHGSFIVYDLHSYNHRREGPNGPAAAEAENPEVNVGTGTLDRERWAPVVDGFIDTLRAQEVGGRALDVRENVKFKGGYFSQWIHENYPETGCALAIEFKKIFMDEWTGEPDRAMIEGLKQALGQTIPVVLQYRLL